MNLVVNGTQSALRIHRTESYAGSEENVSSHNGLPPASIPSLYHLSVSRSQSSSSSGSGGRATPSALLSPTTNISQQQSTVVTNGYNNNNNNNSIANPIGLIQPTAENTPPPNVNLRRYPCKLCPSMFDSKAELQIHTQVHMREAKPYKCTHCPKSFANSSYLSQHMRIHLGIKPFGPCQYCGRKFTQLSHLQQHLRTHTGEKPYKCRYPGCEKAFSQLSNLQSHSRCHQTDKPFKCNSCYKCFTDENSLLEHIPKHKESKHLKIHICPYCGKSYTQATYLAKHMTKHADKRDRDARIRAAAGISDEGMWPRDSPICPQHGVVDACGEASPTALPFNTFSAHHGHPMMQSQNCGYGGNNLSAMAGMTGSDPTSAFTRLAGLNPGLVSNLGRMSSGRSHYFPYENFKSPSTGLNHHSHSGFPNQLIRLDDIRNYSANMPSTADSFNLLMNAKRETREAY